ncbi:hypothetical protein ES703_57248 [subsurface metagenome]
MKAKGKKLVSLFLVFSLVAISCTTIKTPGQMRIEPKKRGTNLVIQKKDGRQISGELIAVKENSLLLLDSESGADVSVDIKDIKVIKMKKSMTRLGMGIGCVAGVLTGLGFAKALSDLHDGIDSQWYLILPLICAVPLSFLGGIIGGFVKADKTIQIEGMTDSEIKDAMDKLRKKARIRDYK